MFKKVPVLLLAVFVVAASAATVFAIKYGELDGNAHPYVGLMVAQDANGAPMWRCSGTLVSPTLFLTAGHCTEAPADHVEIWFQADVQSGLPDNGYPYKGQASGTPFTHPDFDFPRADVGVVVLQHPYKLKKYGALPTEDQLEALKTTRGLQDVTFTAVGYGLQESFPDAASWQMNNVKVRMVAYPQLLQMNTAFTGTFSLLLSNNANSGGTCFGDSGGPNFIGNSNVIGGVTSYGINGNCAGTGGVYRMDRAEALNWVKNTFSRHLD